jgi:hypothetical protein
MGLADGLDAPPDGVSAGAARCDRRLPAQRRVVTSEGREDDAALGRLVPVVEEEAGHAASLPPPRAPYIGATP